MTRSRNRLREHARDVFSQGYAFAVDKHGHDDAIRKSLNGLARFLALPLDFYSARRVRLVASRLDLRPAPADLLGGERHPRWICDGAARKQDGRPDPSTISAPVAALHGVPDPVPRGTDHRSPGARPSCRRVESIGPAAARRHPVFPRATSGGLLSGSGCRAVFVVPKGVWTSPFGRPRTPCRSACWRPVRFWKRGSSRPRIWTRAERRQTRLIIAPLRPDVQRIVREREDLAAIVVRADQPRTDAAREAFRIWERAIFVLRSQSQRSTPIAYNFARDFPLHDPNKETFFRIPRTSVRDLLRTFERRPRRAALVQCPQEREDDGVLRPGIDDRRFGHRQPDVRRG